MFLWQWAYSAPSPERTQQVSIEFSTDGGNTFRRWLVQEYTFGPGGSTYQGNWWSCMTGESARRAKELTGQYIHGEAANWSGRRPDHLRLLAPRGARRWRTGRPALIESLLVYSRVTASERGLEIVELEDALALAKQNLALSIEGTDAVIECHTPLPVMRADRIQLIQLFQNLSSNAIKFRGARAPHVHIAYGALEDMHVLEFRDESVNPTDAKPNEGATFSIRLPKAGNTET